MDSQSPDYIWMLERAMTKIPKHISTKPRFEPPQPRSRMEGSRTLILNFEEICSYLKRDKAHLLKFLTKSLGAPGILDNGRALLQGSFDQDLISRWIQSYIKRYVLCNECSKPDTVFIKEARITYIKCEACGAKYPAPHI